jgi:hypothetical protein
MSGAAVDRSASLRVGAYQFFERLGEGGSGQVYRAEGPAGMVAVKILGPAADLDEAARARFRREIGALQQLRHPNLVPLLDHGFDDELGPYLVLPLLPGLSLRDVVGGRAICPEAAILLAQPIAAAAAALHAAGYVHRDLKPENAIAGPDGTLTVIDLGLAWRDGMTRHTESGAAVGSIGYMAPEQIEGGTVGAAADVWALGVMIHEWIAGKRPFARARPTEEAAAALVGAFPRLTAADRRADEALAELVARCLAADPATRPAAAELAEGLAPMIDWAAPEALAAERAAVIADPAGYQARVAPFRVRRLERLAREALAGGRPFAALAACDRALAYAPGRPELEALVAEVEAATGGAPAPPPRGEAPPRRRRSFAIAGGVVGVVAGVAIAAWVAGDHGDSEPPRGEPAPAAAPAPPGAETQATGDEAGQELARDMLDVFGRALDLSEKQPAAAREPATAQGWLELARTQPPALAVLSVRRALELQPGWRDAERQLCALYTVLGDPGAAAPPCANDAR